MGMYPFCFFNSMYILTYHDRLERNETAGSNEGSILLDRVDDVGEQV